MTTYIDGKAVGVGTIRAEIGVSGNVLHDSTLKGNGNTEPLGVDTEVVATTNQVGNLVTTLNTAIAGKQDKLTAGENIIIEDGVISATGGGGGSYTAGTGIDITNDVVSITAPTLKNVSPDLDNGLAITNNVYHLQGNLTTVIGIQAYSTYDGQFSTVVGANASSSADNGIAIGCRAETSAKSAIQIGCPWAGSYTNSDENTFKAGNDNGNFEMMSADGTIPTDRYTTTPTTAGTYVPKLTIAEDGTATREWGTESGGASLPDQTDNAGKFLMTDGATASWSDKPIVNNSTKNHSVAIGDGALAGNYSVSIGSASNINIATGSVALGYNAGSTGSYAVSVGYLAKALGAGSTQLGSLGLNKTAMNRDADTFKVANRNGNFEMMSADGTIPAARHASLPTEDGSYVLKCVITDGVPTVSWVKE